MLTSFLADLFGLLPAAMVANIPSLSLAREGASTNLTKVAGDGINTTDGKRNGI